MKRVRFPETLMVLINILIVTQSGRLKQMNYLELYNKCLGDYGVMYKTLNEEINSYYKREQSLLETVKNTVILAYQKTQLAEETFRKSKEEWDKTVLDLDKKIKELEMQLKNEIELKEESLKENSFLKEKIITLNKEIENKFKQSELLANEVKETNLLNEASDKNLLMVRQELKKVNESNDKLSSEIKVCVSQMEMLRKSTKDNYDKLAMQFTQDEEIIKRLRIKLNEIEKEEVDQENSTRRLELNIKEISNKLNILLVTKEENSTTVITKTDLIDVKSSSSNDTSYSMDNNVTLTINNQTILRGNHNKLLNLVDISSGIVKHLDKLVLISTINKLVPHENIMDDHNQQSLPSSNSLQMNEREKVIQRTTNHTDSSYDPRNKQHLS